MSDHSVAAATSKNKGLQFALVLPAFVFTTLLSSALLFFVQPLMARLTLPLLGGSPSVWAVTMCFFQTMLLAGYAYAHALIRLAPVRLGVVIHVTMLALAALTLTFDVAPASAENLTRSESLQLLIVLASTVGLPFAVMSANAPLIQSWFSLSGHKDAREPYFLYGASNLGSMAALLLYPALVEPFVGLHDQTSLWASGFMLLVAAIAACGTLTTINRVSPVAQTAAPVLEASPTWSRRGYWLIMAFMPSALLVAWTNHITTDIAAAPFLWLPPLVLYLLSFIAVFQAKPWFSDQRLRVAQIIAAPLVLILMTGSRSLLMLPILPIGAIAFFATACLCHHAMYVSRPAARHLTEFYLLMSLGGVVGGLFVSLLAPLLFNDVTEYPLLLILSLLLARDVIEDQCLQQLARRPLLLVLAATVIALLSHVIGGLLGKPAWVGVNALFVGGLAVAVYLLAKAERKFLMGAFICLLVLQLGVTQEPTLYRARNFFGVLSIKTADDYVLMYHGTTVHGAQHKNELEPGFTGRPAMMTYYTPTGGIGRAVLASQQHLAAEQRQGKFGVVGLGAGLLSCYSKPGENWRYFEINADVVHAARDLGYFSFMKSCAPDTPVIIGDARLKLKSEEAASYDTLVIDAFSSDSVPVHLITTEAMQLYLSLLKPDGTLVMHITNRHLDLQSVVAANVQALSLQGVPLYSRYIRHEPPRGDYADNASDVVVLSRKADVLAGLDENPETKALSITVGVPAWTDDYSNILGAIWRKL